ncbi:hypothetical protein LCGC14_2099580 [marine sediment metagenome]|uniref:Uncharacterized protein n=1 Tax=marine sediment metagenome TaxID=412755 RepID=A0A0F9EXJ9_9ZZZZ
MIDEVFMFVFKDSHDEMIIDRSILERMTGFGTGPMLWCRNGLFCVIPKEVIQNALETFNIYNNVEGKILTPNVVIMWSQGIPISNLAGRALVGE